MGAAGGLRLSGRADCGGPQVTVGAPHRLAAAPDRADAGFHFADALHPGAVEPGWNFASFDRRPGLAARAEGVVTIPDS